MAINFNYAYNYPQIARESGFKLRLYKDGPLDWRLLGSLDLERMQREHLFEQVDGVLSHLAEVPLANMLETNILDSGIAKYFLLSQYAVQYLLFIRKFLDETVAELREAYGASQLEVARLRQQRTEADNEILQLHKKITQIEAIHEVVYPCAFCTKSFVSNESLNLHIGRKHPGSTSNNNKVTISKADKVDDMNLISTIKMELEIKQLKERLNVAEREIRERSAANSKRHTPRGSTAEPQMLSVQEESKARLVAAVKAMKSIGIQSNLIEDKEQDDTNTTISELAQDTRGEELLSLQQKVREFDEWRESLRHNNDATMAEINKKLSELSLALATGAKEATTTRASSPAAAAFSMVSLEEHLMQKVSDIGKASAEKLEEAVYHMELNYKEKLEQLEHEITRRKTLEREMVGGGAAKKMLQRTQTIIKAATESSESASEEAPQPVRMKRSPPQLEIVVVEAVEEVQTSKQESLKGNDDTYEIEVVPTAQKKWQEGEQKQEKLAKQELAESKAKTEKPKLDVLAVGSLSSEESSNQTFIKATEVKNNEVKVISATIEPDGQTTDVSESLEQESSTESEASTIESEQGLPKKEEARPKTVKRKSKAALATKKTTPPKSFTRRDAKRLAQRKLEQIGLGDSKRSISHAMWKKGNDALVEDRTVLRQKYPNFYATRNKLKKFVDKLCSSKLPPKAEAMLKGAQPKQPPQRVSPRKHKEQPEEVLEEDESSLSELVKASTPRDDFKQRLESLLASPIRRPPGTTIDEELPNSKTFAADVHARPMPVPVPVPRKRVMFNTGSTELSRRNVFDI